MNRILVTGGTGFIGSHTCLALLERGYEVVVIDSLVNSSKKVLDRLRKISLSTNFKKEISFFEGDITDLNFLDCVFKESIKENKPIKSVIHFAGLKSVNESVTYPLKYWENNVQGTLSLLKIMKKNDCKTIVFSSSASIYGFSNKFLIDENSDINPINPYGTTKMVIEQFLHNIFKSNLDDWRIICLRYFNPIGAHSSGHIGENPLGVPNNIFPALTRVALGQISELKIFGNDWPTEDGTCIRDYIHVMDLAEGHISALEFLRRKKKNFGAINLGTGNGTSILELLKVFQEVNKVELKYSFAPRREGDVARLVASNELALNRLNWSPRRTLEQMCKDGWKWQKNNPKGYI